MAHHLFIMNQRSLAMNDYDVALVGHFLSHSANELKHPAIDSLSRWHYEGPGVWTGIEERALSCSPDLFTAAITFISKFGDSIPVSYLRENLNFTDIDWLSEHPTHKVADCVHRLRNFIMQNTQQDIAPAL
jgi:hypothetical protein